MGRCSAIGVACFLQVFGICIASRTDRFDQDGSLDIAFLSNSRSASAINPLEPREDMDFPWSPASIYTATLLATKYQLLPKGRTDGLKLIIPKPKIPGALRFNVSLLARYPAKATFITQKQFLVWKNDHPVDKTIYVTFKYLANYIQQPRKMFLHKANVSAACTEELIPGIRQIMSEDGVEAEMPKTNCYISSMVLKFWTRERLNFGVVLMKLLSQHPEHRVLFVGYSLGGPQAQAAALRFRLVDMRKMPDDMRQRVVWYPDGPSVLSENGLKWTDEAGAKVFQHYFGDRSLQLVSAMSSVRKKRIYDGVPRFDTRLSPILPIKILDLDNGKLLDCRSDGDPPCPTSTDSKTKVMKTFSTTHNAYDFLKRTRCIGWPQHFPTMCKA
eukprot:TRINITY_DN2847_c0_g3_i1.p1 TRINITY_DN2847_c0_g3~~TRINITY_DN2847_c0_g3_i1.p1  ORF type:complete len:386 (+),score=43.44 TRINITY_DN2847_c0_g3_i1:36-1193(+)